MALFRIINKFFSFLYFLLKFQSTKIAYYFSHYHVTFYEAALVKRKGSDLLFTNSGNQIPISQLSIFQFGIKILIKVLNNKEIKITTVTPSGFELQVNDIKLICQSFPNIITVYEIYIEKLYSIFLPESNNIILDIGMNVGYASLFFASLDDVAHVYSFEPFPETFNEAVKNINNNEKQRINITPYNYGISNKTGILNVPIFESGSSSASTNTDIINGIIDVDTSKTLSVELKSIEDVLNPIFLKHPNQTIIMKVDCEGEEYGIMDLLNKTQQINKIKTFFIEWHLKGSEPIVEILKTNGFTVLDLARTDVASGMLYAFKQ